MSKPEQTSFVTKEDDEKNNIIGGIAVDRLRSLIERIERLEEKKPALHQTSEMFMPKLNQPDLMQKLCVHALSFAK